MTDPHPPRNRSVTPLWRGGWTRLRRGIGLALLASACAPASQSTAETAGAEPPPPADASIFLVSLYRNGRDQTDPCVWVTPSAERAKTQAALQAYHAQSATAIELPDAMTPCLNSIAALRAHDPPLPGAVSAPNLAGALHHLGARDRTQESRVFHGKPIFDFETLLGPFDLSEHTVWKQSAINRGPAPTELRDATFGPDHKTLHYDAMTRTQFSVTDHVLVIEAEHVTVTLGDDAWSRQATPVPEIDYQAPRVAEVVRVMGGPAHGIVLIPLADGDWYVAVEPGAEASRYAWRDRDGKGPVTAFASLDALIAAHPSVGEPAGLARAAVVLSRHYVESGVSVIQDADAWKHEYRTKGYRTLINERYDQGPRHDQVVYTVADFDAIQSPTLVGETLVVHLAGERNHQPYRVAIDLRALTMDTHLDPTFLATFVTIPDARDGIGPARQ